jgi:hypothetical protein
MMSARHPAPAPTSSGLVPSEIVVDEYEVVDGEVVAKPEIDGRYAYADPTDLPVTATGPVAFGPAPTLAELWDAWKRAGY